MTPKEKAKSIVKDMFMIKNLDFDQAKQCAWVAIYEIVEFMRMDDEYTQTASNANSKWVHYWQEVKQEIEKL